MAGDIIGDQIAKGVYGLSDAHFAYTAAIERLYSMEYQASGTSLLRTIPGGTLSEAQQVLRWEVWGSAGGAGCTVTVTFGGVEILTFGVSASQAFYAKGELIRTGASSLEGSAMGANPPATITISPSSVGVSLAVDQDLVASVVGAGSIMNVLRTGLCGAP